jgi:pimeloyl-ACP methyl ester carboxylesterase
MQKQEGFSEVNGTRLYYEVAGTGYPLALIHGFAGDTTYWDDQFEVFAQHYKVIRYDRRGFGRSANPTEQRYSHFDDLKALLEHLGISQTHILGHSDGCAIAVDFALAYPDMTRSLLPVSGGPNGFAWPQELDDEVDKVFNAAQENARKFGVKAGNEALLQVPIIKASLENPDAALRLAQLLSNYPGWHWLNQDPAVELNPPAAGRLDQIKVPTCIIVGEKEYEGNLLGAEFMHQHISNAQKTVVRGAGHLVNIEAPRQFNEIVLSFLAKT